MESNRCENCKYDYKSPYEKPCDSCCKWVDGYLETTNYKPVVDGINCIDCVNWKGWECKDNCTICIEFSEFKQRE